MISLSKSQARRLVLASQQVHSSAEFGCGVGGLANAIEHLGYIQIDTISVVERAHHHTLWNRLRNYSPKLLDQALEQRLVFEYWSHAAAYLPMRDYRYSLPRKNAIASGERHWFDKDPKQAKLVLDRIRADGPLQASDFAQTRSIKRAGWGDQKPAKRALEQLFMEGELMVARRQGFQKVFDLTERVLPANVDTSTPSDTEFYDHLIHQFLFANGLGSAADIAYLRKGLKPLIQARINELLENGQLCKLAVNGQHYVALANFAESLEARVSRTKVKILSPFDNLLIQRQRMRDLFDFDYQIECYVPAAKRKFGYFCLPILAGQEFIGRMDAKIDRANTHFKVLNLALESDDFEKIVSPLKRALADFVAFNKGASLSIERATLNDRALAASQLTKLLLST